MLTNYISFPNMRPFYVFEELACSDTFYAEGGDRVKERNLQRGGNEVAFHQELVAQLAAAERRSDLNMQ